MKGAAVPSASQSDWAALLKAQDPSAQRRSTHQQRHLVPPECDFDALHLVFHL